MVIGLFSWLSRHLPRYLRAPLGGTKVETRQIEQSLAFGAHGLRVQLVSEATWDAMRKEGVMP